MTTVEPMVTYFSDFACLLWEVATLRQSKSEK